MIHLFPDTFLEEIRKGIPGEQSHIKMMPLNRPLSSIAVQSSISIRESAVSINLYREDEQIHCILIQRPTYDGVHSGQISFPGGKKDPDDVDLEFTARRENFEEIGIAIDQGILLGELTDVYIPVSSFLVKPFIFFYEELPDLHADSREVAEIFSFSLEELTLESSFSTMEIQIQNGIKQKNIPCLVLGGKEIWGATALILNELRGLILLMLNIE